MHLLRSRLASFAVLACLAAASAPQSAAAPAARPNIVFLLSDDQTAGAVGCYGNPDVITPHLDRLARDGVRFTNHYNTTSICMASRVSILTGLFEYRHGCNFGHGDLARRFLADAYPARLRAAGYFTGFAGKLGFDLAGEPFAVIAREFDAWAGGPGQTFYETEKNEGIAKYAAQHPHSSRAYAAWAADFFRDARRSGKPFCVSISFKAPHLPFTPDPADLKLYESRRTFARPANYGVAHQGHLAPHVKTSRAAQSYREWITDYDATARLYYALITGVDAAVGMIRDALAREGFAENTVIIFTSDNGYSAGAHGFGDKVLPYEEASRAPLIIHDPRRPRTEAGRVSAALTGNVDLAATLLALAGVPAPAGLDGRDLAPLIANPAAQVRDALPLFNFWGAPPAQSMAVVTPEWKYIHWFWGDGLAPTEELFHLAEDRLELRNVAAEPRHAAALATMRRHYDAEHAAIAARVFPGNNYPPYATLFDRDVPWEKKAPLARTVLSSAGEPKAKAKKKAAP